MLAPVLAGCQGLLCAEAASHWLVGLGHEIAGCGIPGGPRARAGSLMIRAGGWDVWFQGQCSWIYCWSGSEWGQFLTQLAACSRVSQSWCWSSGECGWVLGQLAEESKVSWS